jgi:biopolymer transport protein ExbD
MTPTPPTDWLVRLSADPNPRPVPTPEAVLEGVRDGDWEPSDEVRGPGDRMWVPIEEHPLFADAISGMGPPPPEPVDETTLDMNPLIDVALVLLIFFILTATVQTLRRTIDLPSPTPDEGQTRVPTQQQLQDRAFTLTVTLDERNEPIVKATTGPGSERVLDYERLEKELKEVVKSTGRNEMILKVHPDVEWQVWARVYSAATDAEVRQVHVPGKKK